jgi:hypothetical protein
MMVAGDEWPRKNDAETAISAMQSAVRLAVETAERGTRFASFAGRQDGARLPGKFGSPHGRRPSSFD